MLDYNEYLERRDKKQKENEKYLEIFRKSLVSKGLSVKTIDKHCSNVSFFLNDFLNYYEFQDMTEGCYLIDEFLGEWCIEKCLFASKNYIKNSAASIKKFYRCMLENNYISNIEYDYLCSAIKNNKGNWLELMDAYDNGVFDAMLEETFGKEEID